MVGDQPKRCLSQKTTNARLWVVSDHRLPRQVHFPACVLSVSPSIISVVVQLPSHVQFFNAPLQASLSLTVTCSSLKFLSTASAMPSSHLILGCPLLLLPSSLPSIRDFLPMSQLLASDITKYWSFSFSITYLR